MMGADGILDKSGAFQYYIQDDGTIAIVRCLERIPTLRIPEILDDRKVTISGSFLI